MTELLSQPLKEIPSRQLASRAIDEIIESIELPEKSSVEKLTQAIDELSKNYSERSVFLTPADFPGNQIASVQIYGLRLADNSGLGEVVHISDAVTPSDKTYMSRRYDVDMFGGLDRDIVKNCRVTINGHELSVSAGDSTVFGEEAKEVIDALERRLMTAKHKLEERNGENPRVADTEANAEAKAMLLERYPLLEKYATSHSMTE